MAEPTEEERARQARSRKLKLARARARANAGEESGTLTPTIDPAVMAKRVEVIPGFSDSPKAVPVVKGQAPDPSDMRPLADVQPIALAPEADPVNRDPLTRAIVKAATPNARNSEASELVGPLPKFEPATGAMEPTNVDGRFSEEFQLAAHNKANQPMTSQLEPVSDIYASIPGTIDRALGISESEAEHARVQQARDDAQIENLYRATTGEAPVPLPQESFTTNRNRQIRALLPQQYDVGDLTEEERAASPNLSTVTESPFRYALRLLSVPTAVGSAMPDMAVDAALGGGPPLDRQAIADAVIERARRGDGFADVGEKAGQAAGSAVGEVPATAFEAVGLSEAARGARDAAGAIGGLEGKIFGTGYDMAADPVPVASSALDIMKAALRMRNATPFAKTAGAAAPATSVAMPDAVSSLARGPEVQSIAAPRSEVVNVDPALSALRSAVGSLPERLAYQAERSGVSAAEIVAKDLRLQGPSANAEAIDQIVKSIGTPAVGSPLAKQIQVEQAAQWLQSEASKLAERAYQTVSPASVERGLSAGRSLAYDRAAGIDPARTELFERASEVTRFVDPLVKDAVEKTKELTGLTSKIEQTRAGYNKLVSEMRSDLDTMADEQLAAAKMRDVLGLDSSQITAKAARLKEIASQPSHVLDDFVSENPDRGFWDSVGSDADIATTARALGVARSKLENQIAEATALKADAATAVAKANQGDYLADSVLGSVAVRASTAANYLRNSMASSVERNLGSSRLKSQSPYDQFTSLLERGAGAGLRGVGLMASDVADDVARSAPLLGTTASIGRSGMLGGSAMIRPLFHVNNALTAPMIIHSTLGSKAAIDSLIMAPEGALILKQLANPTESLGKQIAFHTPGNGPYTYDRLAALIASEGLQGQARFELGADAISDVLAQIQPNVSEAAFDKFVDKLADPLVSKTTAAGRAIRKLGRTTFGTKPGVANKALHYIGGGDGLNLWNEIGNQSDMWFRSNVIAGALKSGKTEAEAMQMGRDALFDYSKMSDVERKSIARVVWYWAFRRSNYANLLRQSLTNPGRVMAQGRAANDWMPSTDPGDEDFESSPWMADRTLYGRIEEEVNAGDKARTWALYGPGPPMMDAVKDTISVIDAGLKVFADPMNSDAMRVYRESALAEIRQENKVIAANNERKVEAERDAAEMEGREVQPIALEPLHDETDPSLIVGMERAAPRLVGLDAVVDPLVSELSPPIQTGLRVVFGLEPRYGANGRVSRTVPAWIRAAAQATGTWDDYQRIFSVRAVPYDLPGGGKSVRYIADEAKMQAAVTEALLWSGQGSTLKTAVTAVTGADPEKLEPLSIRLSRALGLASPYPSRSIDESLNRELEYKK